MDDSRFELRGVDHLGGAILELTYVTALYEMHAVVSRAPCTEHDDYEDRVTEHQRPDRA